MSDLRAAELEGAARAATGLEDFGEGSYREGLEVLLDSLRGEARLSEAGVQMTRLQLVGYLARRLEATDWLARHPEIARERIVAPLVVVGEPRTGTTLLSFLLDCDPENRSLLQWEGMHTLPPPEAATHRSDPRVERTRAELAALEALAPGFQAIHYQQADGPTECVTLLASEFKSLQYTVLWNVPRYVDWLLASDMGSAYAHHRLLLQLLQWRVPTRHWSLKSPGHLHALPELVAAYPDAVLVATHRHPTDFVTSTASTLAHLRRVASESVDPAACGAQALHFLGVCADRMLEFRDRAAARILDLTYRELTRGPIASVRRIYAHAGRELAPVAERRMREWLAAHPRDAHGPHRYRLEDFGLTRDRVEERFAAYLERFEGAGRSL